MLSSNIQFNAVKGLMISLPEIGKLKIGRLDPDDSKMRTTVDGRAYRLPEKLHFIQVTTRLKGPHDQWIPDEEITKQLPDFPTELPIILVYNDPSLNAQSRLCCYRGSKRWCHGDNERAQRMDEKGIYREQSCPCPLLLSPGDDLINRGIDQKKWTRCRFHGVFRCQIPLKRSSQGVFAFRTTSTESISNILGVQLSILMHTRIWVKGGLLSGLPLRFRVYPSTDNTPGGASTSYKATLDLPPGGWDEIDEAAKRMIQNQFSSRATIEIMEAEYTRKLKAIGAGDLSAEALMEELYPAPVGSDFLDEEPDGDGGPIINTTATNGPPKPPAAQAAAASEPEKALEATAPTKKDLAKLDGPPPPDAVLLFTENYGIEGKAGSPEVKAEAIKAQVEALEVLAKRRGYDFTRLLKPLTDFSREQRHGFFEHLKAMPDVEQQAALPWGT
jgi:hypothetical protein